MPNSSKKNAANRRYAQSAKGVATRKAREARKTKQQKQVEIKRSAATRKAYRETPHGKAIITNSQTAHFNSTKGRVGAVLCDIRGRCREKGLPYDLDREWLTDRYETCELTGIKFVHKVYVQGSGPRWGNDFAPSVDRIIPELGYIKSNCRVILMCVNAFKRTMTDEQMLTVAKALLESS